MLTYAGNEVHVTPITLYIEKSKLDTPYSFWEVVQLGGTLVNFSLYIYIYIYIYV